MSFGTKRLRVFLVNVGFRHPLYALVTPPLGVMYLAAYLRSKFDADVRIVNQRLYNCSNNDLVKEIADFEADVVGLGAITPMAHYLAQISRQVRAALPKSLIILGGPHVSAFGAKAMARTDADAAVPGEGELALEMIIRAHLDGADFSGIPGVVWRNAGGEVVTNPGAVPVVKDVDSLPFPAYDLIDLPAYWRRQSMAPIPRRKYVSIFSSRGCPYGCKWCHCIFGKRFRAHSAERIADEVEHYQRTYGVRDVEFIDDIFNHDRKRVLEFCELAQRRNLGLEICFPNAVRGDTLTEEVIDALVSAGMYWCSFALETGSPRLQEDMGKRLNIPRFLENIELTARRGVFTNGFMMLGFPTETEEEMQQTIDVACESPLHTASFFPVTPFPGTEIYDMVMRANPEKFGHLDYDDLSYCEMNVNLSTVPDDVLFRYLRKANRQFFMNPRRLARIVRDFPQRRLLPMYAPTLAYRLTKGLFS